MISSAERRAFEQRGFLSRPGLLGAELARDLGAALARAEHAADHGGAPNCIWTRTPVLRQLRLLNAVEFDDAFLKAIDLPDLVELAEAFVPSPFRVIEVCGVSRRAGPGVPLHSFPNADFRVSAKGPRTCVLKIAIALTDIQPEDGPLVMFDGSHRLDDFPYDRLPPDWDPTGIDPEVEDASRRALRGRQAVPWREIPGYREIPMSAGDAVVFTDDLWHGANPIRSNATRRLLAIAYAPYHFANLHGIEYSDALIARASPRQRALLSGPFHGTIYSAAPPKRAPEELGFATLGESATWVDFEEDGARPIGGGTSEPTFLTPQAALSRLVRPSAQNEDEDLSGTCTLDIEGQGGGHWTIHVENGVARLLPGRDASAETVIELRAPDLSDVAHGMSDPVRLYQQDLLRVRGNVSLAMRLVDRWLA